MDKTGKAASGAKASLTVLHVTRSDVPADVSGYYEVLDSLMIMTYDQCTAACKQSAPNISMDKSCAPVDMGGDMKTAVE